MLFNDNSYGPYMTMVVIQVIQGAQTDIDSGSFGLYLMMLDACQCFCLSSYPVKIKTNLYNFYNGAFRSRRSDALPENVKIDQLLLTEGEQDC